MQPRLNKMPAPGSDVIVQEFALLLDLLHGRRALEIAGPTVLFLGFGNVGFPAKIYDTLVSCDYVVEPNQHEVFATERFQMESQTASTTARTFYMDAANISTHFGASSYDLLEASHVLEHMRDPIAAIAEWDRVLEPQGLMLLILPHREFTFDPFRQPDTMQQLLQRHVGGLAKVPAHFDPRFDTMVRSWDVTWPAVRDGYSKGRNETGPALAETSGRRKLQKRLTEKGGVGTLHWHVFDFDLIV